MTVEDLVKATTKQLKAAAEPGFDAQLLRFFKEPVDPYGVRSKQVHQIANGVYRELKRWPQAERDRFMDELWKGGKLEEGAVVCYVCRRFSKTCAEREFAMFERWLDRYVTNWAHTDGVASWLLTASIANRPELISKLPRWTKSKNRWKRRAAAVALLQEASQAATRRAFSRFASCSVRIPTRWCRRASDGCSRRLIRAGLARFCTSWMAGVRLHRDCCCAMRRKR